MGDGVTRRGKDYAGNVGVRRKRERGGNGVTDRLRNGEDEGEVRGGWDRNGESG